MKEYAARFVGEFTYGGSSVADKISNVGDVALFTECPDGRRRVAIRCACGDYDFIPIDRQPGVSNSSWQLTSREPVNLEPSIRVSTSHAGVERTLCHYWVHGGRLQMLDDTTRPLMDSFP